MIPITGLVKKAFKKACRDLKAELAFIWIAFAVTTALALYLFVLGNRKHKRIGRQVGSTHLPKNFVTNGLFEYPGLVYSTCKL
jgi:hypothetical protein